MLEIKPAGLQAWEVEYEPGDCTRYSFYIIYINWSYHIIANNSTFKLPRIIQDYELLTTWNEDQIEKRSDEIGCNPYTLKAVLDVLKKIKESV